MGPALQRLSITLVALLIGCSGGDPQVVNLKQGVRDMKANIRSATYKDLLQKSGASTATAGVQVLFSSTAAANWKLPPEGIGFSPETPTKSWIVVVRGDDAGRALIIEGFGEDTTKPLLTESIPFPPD